MGTKSGRYTNRDAAIKAYDAGRTIYRVLAMVEGKPYQGFYVKREAQRLAVLVGGEAIPVDPHHPIT